MADNLSTREDIKGIEEIPPEICRGLRGIFFDIDDTFTTHGKILPEAFSVLWEVKQSGLIAVPITGRPAGWADHIARMWPVEGIVGENGAFYFFMDSLTGVLQKRFVVEDPAEREQSRHRLAGIYHELQALFPGIMTASDQFYRECDIAVDFCEDVHPPRGLEDARRIRDFFERHGAHARISSIHVNAWFGDYDKLTMCKIFAEEHLGISLDEERERFLFCGDSPNDCPMFGFFPFSAGVASVRRFLDAGLMHPPPAFVASQEGSRGFEEIMRKVLSCR